MEFLPKSAEKAWFKSVLRLSFFVNFSRFSFCWEFFKLHLISTQCQIILNPRGWHVVDGEEIIEGKRGIECPLKGEKENYDRRDAEKRWVLLWGL